MPTTFTETSHHLKRYNKTGTDQSGPDARGMWRANSLPPWRSDDTRGTNQQFYEDCPTPEVRTKKYFYPTRSAVTGFVAYFCPSLGLKSGPQELSLPDAFHDRSYDSTRHLFCSVVLAIRQCATVGVQQNFPRS